MSFLLLALIGGAAAFSLLGESGIQALWQSLAN